MNKYILQTVCVVILLAMVPSATAQTKLVDLRPVKAEYLTRKNPALPAHKHGRGVWWAGGAYRVWGGGHFWSNKSKTVRTAAQLPDGFNSTSHPGGYKSWEEDRFVVNGESVTGVGLWLRIMSMEHWVEYRIPEGTRSFNAVVMLTDDNRGYMHGQAGNNYVGFRAAELKVLVDGKVVHDAIKFSHFGRHGMTLGEIDINLPPSAKRLGFHLVGSDGVDWNKNTELVISEGVFEATAVAGESAGHRIGTKRENATRIDLELPTDGRASLGIYDQQDRMVRVLLHGDQREAGPVSVDWDGLDWQGRAVAPGEYTWRLVNSPELSSRFLFRLGTSVPDEPWQRWVGDHVPVTSMAADEKGFVFTSHFSEVPDMIIGFDRSLKKRTVSSHQWYDGNELCSTGIASGRLFGLTRQGKIRALNRDTLKIEATWDYIATPGGEFVSPNHLAANGTTLVATDVAENRIHYLNSQNGQRVRSVEVDDLRRLAVQEDGTVFVTTGTGKILMVTTAGRTRVVVDGLADPQAVAVDSKNGDLFVFVGGQSSQIRHYDRNGRLLSTFGRKGGRLPVPYAADDFSAVQDMLPDGNGHLLIAEAGLVRRVAKLEIRSGRIVDEWFGGNGYYNYAVVSPDNPEEVWFEPFVNSVQRVRMDYDSRTWKIQAAYCPSPPLPGGGAAGFPYLRWFPFTHNGRRYMLNSSHWLYVEDEPRKVLRAIRIVEKKGDGVEVWSDLNEDQQRTDNEVVKYPAEAAQRFAKISGMDRDRNLYFQGPGTTAYSTLSFGGWHQGNKAIPTWDYGAIRSGPELPDVLKQNPDFGSLFVDSKGRIHQTRGAMRMPGDERHGQFWPAIELSVARYLQWSGGKDSELRTITGKHQTNWGQSKSNVLTQPGLIIGEVDGLIAACDRAGQPTGVTWDRETGLYVGNLLEHRAEDGLPDWVYDPWKRVDFGGGQLYRLKDGRVIWLMQDWNNHAVMEVTGLDRIRRASGKVRLTKRTKPADAKGTGLRGTYYRQRRFQGEAFSQVDSFFRCGPRNTNDYGFKSKEWVQTLEKHQIPVERFSVVWQGELEPPVDEDYQFSMYLTGSARLYLDDRLILDTTESGSNLFKGYQHNVSGDAAMATSAPVRLQGGTRIPIRIEWNSSGIISEQYLGYRGPMFHLNWESPMHDRLAVPTKYLYPSQGN